MLEDGTLRLRVHQQNGARFIVVLPDGEIEDSHFGRIADIHRLVKITHHQSHDAFEEIDPARSSFLHACTMISRASVRNSIDR